METKAILKYARTGDLKAREVADRIRGLNVNEAMNLLNHNRRKAAQVLSGVLKSAIANAEQTKIMDVDNLYIKIICVDKTSGLKRFRAGARGSSFPYTRKQSHITMVLDER